MASILLAASKYVNNIHNERFNCDEDGTRLWETK